MDKETANGVDICLIAFGTLFGISDVKSILGIIILVVQIVWVTLKVVFAIRDHVKKKDAKGIVDDAKQYADDLTEIYNNVDKKKEEDDGKRDESAK